MSRCELNKVRPMCEEPALPFADFASSGESFCGQPGPRKWHARPSRFQCQKQHVIPRRLIDRKFAAEQYPEEPAEMGSTSPDCEGPRNHPPRNESFCKYRLPPLATQHRPSLDNEAASPGGVQAGSARVRPALRRNAAGVRHIDPGFADVTCERREWRPKAGSRPSQRGVGGLREK